MATTINSVIITHVFLAGQWKHDMTVCRSTQPHSRLDTSRRHRSEELWSSGQTRHRRLVSTRHLRQHHDKASISISNETDSTEAKSVKTKRTRNFLPGNLSQFLMDYFSVYSHASNLTMSFFFNYCLYTSPLLFTYHMSRLCGRDGASS